MTEPRPWMIYGANGYTGRLIAKEAVRRGQRPILAGRDRARVEPLARELSLEFRAFDLNEAARHLEDIAAVLHCAGPFSHTSAPMVRACLESRAHYLDITGEIAVFEAIFRKHDEAIRAGVALIPGVGFDVVPTDCLAAKLAAALPEATELALAFYARGSTMSRGTLKTMIEGMPHGGAERRNGKIARIPAAHEVREIPFSCGTRTAVTIPWGDIATAFRTTGIPDIRVYSAAPRSVIRRLRLFRPILGLLRFAPVRGLVQHLATRRAGASDAQRANARTWLWGEALSDRERVSLTMETPDGYTLTAMTAVRAVERVLAGQVDAGSWTPARAFGAGFIEEFDGVTVHPMQQRKP
jgi:saccharopine dehydrogenase (NAD+, L-lysine-forming)